MAEQFDVIVVGARCAGSPLATLLARDGARVAVVERATFPRDTLSTHIFEAQALAFLNRLGVIDQIRATGAPILSRADIRQEDVRFVTSAPRLPGDVGGAASVRRFILDPILVDAAAEAGAEVRLGTKVTGLVRDDGRVGGVQTAFDGSEAELRARLVVGADGRNSTVANLVGSRKYNVAPNQRFAYWTFFEGADPGPDPALVFHRWSNRLILGCPADSGLYQVILIPDLVDLPRFREDLEGSFMEYALSCEPVAQELAGATRVGKFFGMLRFEGFLREPSGRGWVLAGDAGHFKDPSPGQGIQDAFRQVDALALAIRDGLQGSDEQLDRKLAAWGRWRDRDAAEHYWFAVDTGKAGPLPLVVPEITRRLVQQGKSDQLIDIFNHRVSPSEVLTPQRLLGATGRLLRRGGCDRRQVLREVRGLIAEDIQRQRLNKHPEYVAAGESIDAGETEVPEAVPA
jgi:flavin-dependent dehydrogenase